LIVAILVLISEFVILYSLVVVSCLCSYYTISVGYFKWK
jgi:hypothetical protein